MSTSHRSPLRRRIGLLSWVPLGSAKKENDVCLLSRKFLPKTKPKTKGVRTFFFFPS